MRHSLVRAKKRSIAINHPFILPGKLLMVSERFNVMSFWVALEPQTPTICTIMAAGSWLRVGALGCRKWQVVSHPLNANPFPGSLLNYKAKLRLYDVTVERQTFMQLECSFETEHQ